MSNIKTNYEEQPQTYTESTENKIFPKTLNHNSRGLWKLRRDLDYSM